MALLSPTLSATKALAERLFAAIDTNANGRLSRVELRAFLLASADESGDPARALLAAELGTAFAASPRKKSSMPPPSMVRQLSDSIDVDGTSGADGSGLGFDEFVYGLTAQLHVRGLLESVGSAGLLEALMHDSGFVEICERFFRARSGCADESKWMFNANELWALFSSHSRLGLSTDEFFQLNEFGQLLNFIFELRGSGSNDGHDKELMKSFFRVSAGVLRAESEVHSPGGRCSLLRHVSDVTESASVARLRIVHVNDVYELGELPSLATLVAQVKAEAAATGATVVCTLGGDFVAPSVLSGLDHGVGMIDCMNQVPFDYVCFGNHESDIPMRQLVQRIKESKFEWINSNMDSFDAHAVLPRLGALRATSRDGTNTRSIALLGLLLADPAIWREGALGGCAATITPIEKSARQWFTKLSHAGHGAGGGSGSAGDAPFDLVVPLTHQLVANDEALARCDIGFPLILGAHDHQEYVGSVTPAADGVTHACTWIKTGADAHRAAVIDIAWCDADASAPDISFDVVTVADYAPNEGIAARAYEHEAAVRALDAAIFLPLGTGSLALPSDGSADALVPRLTSKGHREFQSTMGTLICTAMRDVLNVDVCVIDSGCIRGNSEYGSEAESCINYTAVKNELPFPSAVVTVDMPGSVIAAAIAYSRTAGHGTGGFLQCDRGVYIDNSAGAHAVTHVSIANADAEDHTNRAHVALEADGVYSVCLLHLCLKGMNSNAPIKAWVAEDPEARIPANDSGRPGKPLFLNWLCRRLWRQMPDFATMDAVDGTLAGRLSVEAVKRCLAACVGDLGDGEGIVLKALVSSACPGEAGDAGINEAAYLAARNQPSGEQHGRDLLAKIHNRCAMNNARD